MAAAEEGLDYQKRISQRHFEEAVGSVLESKLAMEQPQAESPAAAQSLETQVRELRLQIQELKEGASKA